MHSNLDSWLHKQSDINQHSVKFVLKQKIVTKMLQEIGSKTWRVLEGKVIEKPTYADKMIS